jgi:hypothetical protein
MQRGIVGRQCDGAIEQRERVGIAAELADRERFAREVLDIGRAAVVDRDPACGGVGLGGALAPAEPERESPAALVQGRIARRQLGGMLGIGERALELAAGGAQCGPRDPQRDFIRHPLDRAIEIRERTLAIAERFAREVPVVEADRRRIAFEVDRERGVGIAGAPGMELGLALLEVEVGEARLDREGPRSKSPIAASKSAAR